MIMLVPQGEFLVLQTKEKLSRLFEKAARVIVKKISTSELRIRDEATDFLDRLAEAVQGPQDKWSEIRRILRNFEEEDGEGDKALRDVAYFFLRGTPGRIEKFIEGEVFSHNITFGAGSDEETFKKTLIHLAKEPLPSF